MQSFDYTITDPMGLHVRPAGQLVKEARKFTSRITVALGDKTIETTRMMAMMQMGIKGGDVVTVAASGDDENEAIEQMKTFFRENL